MDRLDEKILELRKSMKKLNKQQKEYVEKLASPDKFFLTEDEIREVESMGFHETVHMDANRYLGDLSAYMKFTK